ncbi:MAG: single-stranded DNA-binding protein [Candidatus Aminicenantaceae bacterium]
MRDINSLNKVTLIGHLGRNPEIRYLPQSERPVAKFTLATNERFFNPNTNESRDHTEWHRIVAWGKLAEFCEKYLTQGKQVYLEGRLRTRNWEDREGKKRSTTEINAQTIVLLGKRGEPVEEVVPQEPLSSDFPEEDSRPVSEESESDDEVPF